jgi:hypothetical protein
VDFAETFVGLELVVSKQNMMRRDRQISRRVSDEILQTLWDV